MSMLFQQEEVTGSCYHFVLMTRAIGQLLRPSYSTSVESAVPFGSSAAVVAPSFAIETCVSVQTFVLAFVEYARTELVVA